jgi:hypothetical protein
MSITLDYADLDFDDDRAVLLAEETDFEYDLLYAQIVFRVGAADFTFDGYTTLLDAAAILRGRVDFLADRQTNSYESPVAWEKLSFARAGDQVAISANYTEATATVGLTELKEAVVGFHERVTRDLLARYPGLAENPDAAKYLAPDGQGSRPDA